MCNVKVNAAPRLVQAGETVQVFGNVVCPAGTAAGGQTVTILQKVAGTPGLATTGTAVTDSAGGYQLTSAALASNTQFIGTLAGAQSGTANVKVAPKVTLAGPADGSQLFTGAGPFKHQGKRLLSSRVTFSGTVSPTLAGDTVALQRESSIGAEEWRRIGLATVQSDGTYTLVHTFKVPGDANIRVVVRASSMNTRAASESLSYEISQSQNAALTINSSTDPLVYGAPTTISGTAAGAPAGTAVTLVARTRGQKLFSTTVLSTTTNASGAYSFAPQTPLGSVSYRVLAAGKHSATLFQGVKYGLTENASATSIQAGQPLTFTGTVTPAHAGKVVYLQVQEPSGVGYHTIDVGTVAADGTYSIAHTLFTAGAKKYRVKVPGDPQNQGTAGAAVPVTVTAAPAASLQPEAPTNSGQPAQGQL